MAIKKAYQEIITLLQANENKKIKTLLPQIIALCEAKNSGGSEIGKTFLKDEDGETIAIFCYYFKKWMLVDDVEFGAKKSTATGYNTMCKEGVSNWTKQQRVAAKAKEGLLAKVISGDLEAKDLSAAQDEIEVARRAIAESSEAQFHFDTADEVLESLAQAEQDVIDQDEAEVLVADDADNYDEDKLGQYEAP